ncbi:sensor histidine kinase [Mesorhizobium loti]|nr:HAMP domain-containing sensor histidine kinase [Mesorhizobium loti]PLP59241.1 sensor histidine kinase [Mesorhizobium loti]
MRKPRPRSLQWVLVRRLILLQAAMLVIFLGLLTLVLFIAQPRLLVDNEEAAVVVGEALSRDGNGQLVLRETEELKEFRQSFPNLWFVVRDRNGQELRQGNVPAVYAGGGDGLLKSIDRAALTFAQKDLRPAASYANLDTLAGRVGVLASTMSSRDENTGVEVNIDLQIELSRNPDGTTNWMRVGPVLVILTIVMLLPIVIVMGFTTLVTTPAVVRRSLAGLVATAEEASAIDIDNRAVQLPTERVPQEVAPLVHAFNRALARLGEGYEKRNRFLTDAAHELRTPIAIMRTRAELLREDPESRKLLKDIERLSHLAQQLLDRQVLDHSSGQREMVDLVDLARTLAADFAPLTLEAGYDLSFEPAEGKVPVSVRPQQIERVVANLLRNAIEHGGGSGTITVLVDDKGGLEIHDEGPGIPPEERERVFDPFYRLRPRSTGAGLGLNLAREIARLHDGTIEILDGAWMGTHIRLQLPLANAARPKAKSA